MTTYLTEKEINILGIQRTGQHAIIAWTIGHFNKVCFKNAISAERTKCIMGLEPPWWYFDLDKRPDFEIEVSKEVDIRRNQEAIILGTEFKYGGIEMNPSLPSQKEAMSKRCGVDQFSKNKLTIIVLRSPYNHFASVLKWYGPNKGLSKNFSNYWKIFARESLGETNILLGPKITVLYDYWFLDKEYRANISEYIGRPLSDRGLNVVMKVGFRDKRGSSFEGLQYNGEAQRMPVLERWKQFQDDPFFIDKMKDPEMISLSEKLFGGFPKIGQ